MQNNVFAQPRSSFSGAKEELSSMQKFFSNRRLVILVVILVVCFGLMAGSVALRNRRSTPPLIQQFGDDIVGIAGSVVTYPANIIQGGCPTLTS